MNRRRGMMVAEAAQQEQHYSLSAPTHTGGANGLTTSYLVNGEIDLSLLPTGSYRYYQQKLSSPAAVVVYAKTSQYSLGYIYAVIGGDMYSYNGAWHNMSAGEGQGGQQNAASGITATTPGRATEIVVFTRSKNLTACTIDTV